jgi:hypothetical protein
MQIKLFRRKPKAENQYLLQVCYRVVLSLYIWDFLEPASEAVIHLSRDGIIYLVHQLLDPSPPSLLSQPKLLESITKVCLSLIHVYNVYSPPYLSSMASPTRHSLSISGLRSRDKGPQMTYNDDLFLRHYTILSPTRPSTLKWALSASRKMKNALKFSSTLKWSILAHSQTQASIHR